MGAIHPQEGGALRGYRVLAFQRFTVGMIPQKSKTGEKGMWRWNKIDLMAKSTPKSIAAKLILETCYLLTESED